jgi:hypothetical protein
MHLSNNTAVVIFNPEPLYNFVILDEGFSILYNVQCVLLKCRFMQEYPKLKQFNTTSSVSAELLNPNDDAGVLNPDTVTSSSVDAGVLNPELM